MNNLIPFQTQNHYFQNQFESIDFNWLYLTIYLSNGFDNETIPHSYKMTFQSISRSLGQSNFLQVQSLSTFYH